MALIGFLVLFPLLAALVLSIVTNNNTRKFVVVGSAVLISVASVVLAWNYAGSRSSFNLESDVINYVCMIIGIVIAVVVLVFSLKYKNIFAGVLAVVQLIASLVFELGFAHGVHVATAIYIDSLSVIMCLIIGIVGSGICVYALGYMEDFQKHEPETSKDRRPYFFALMFVFLSAMYLIVLSNNMMWIFTGWEITTLCSFLLIGFTKTEEAIANSFRQIIMNLIGGIAFLLAMYVSVLQLHTLDFNQFIIACVQQPNVSVIAVVAIALAGLTKAAQMPFHTWLLGAMVAPTPTSALLHSSTMVKAGVYILIRMAPAFASCFVASTMVVLVGGLTFLFCSLMAISQSNAKRVLAYSTIANLGLITACAGVGSSEAVWAAIFLVIFHAVAKSLLFLCVGTAEHHIGSRDIEDMDNLFERMPRLASFMVLGIMCMFIAPFGMLIAKWATLVSFAASGNIVLIIILGFGSAATFMFWAKWMGKLSAIAAQEENIELSVHRSEWAALWLMVILLVFTCLSVPLISFMLVEPYLMGVTPDSFTFIDSDNLWIMSILVAFICVIYVSGVAKFKAKKVPIYLSGVSNDSELRTFNNSLSGVTQAGQRNLYLENYFGEKKLNHFATVINLALILIAFIAAIAVVLL